MIYEKEKLGKEWFKWKRKELKSKIYWIFLFFLLIPLGNANNPFIPNTLGIKFYIFIFIFFITLINTDLFVRNRKIDRLTTAELQGFTKKIYLEGIIIYIIFAIVITGLFIILDPLI